MTAGFPVCKGEFHTADPLDFPILGAVFTTKTVSNDVRKIFPSSIGFLSEGVWGNPFFFRKERFFRSLVKIQKFLLIAMEKSGIINHVYPKNAFEEVTT